MLPRRVPGYRPEQLDALCASRRGRVGRRGARPRGASTSARTPPALGPAAARAAGPRATAHDALRAALAGAALFWDDLLAATGLEAEAALPALWELVWAGEVTNDAWTPLRAGRRYGVPQARAAPAPLLAPARRRVDRHAGPLVAHRAASSPGSPDRRALAELLLERQGIVTRDGVRAEGIPGGYGAVYGGAARARDARPLPPRLLRRGARRRAVRARRRRRAAARAAARGTGTRRGARARGRRPRPAVRRRAAVAEAGRRPGRARRGRARRPARRRAGALRRARRPLARAAARAGGGRGCAPALAALVAHVRRGGSKRLAVERFDGEPVAETAIMPLLLEAGFLAGPRRAVLRP